MKNEHVDIVCETIKWGSEKNEKLISERGISFEEIEKAIRE